MRFIIYGVGAIGGTIAARLAASGAEVLGIARGAMLDAINSRGGLDFVTPSGRERVSLPCAGAPDEIHFRPDDVVVLAMKSQDTESALVALQAAGLTDQPVVCAQNGVANERMALRHFPNVYGMTVMLPAQYLTPGEVVAFGAPKLALFDLGRYPAGQDRAAEAVAVALRQAGFGCDLREAVMASKYGKLLMNLGNIIGAAFGSEARNGPWGTKARTEAETVLAAAGIAFEDVGLSDPRRSEMKISEVSGVTRTGSSSQQSLLRGAGSIETDYLNGEIVLLGRLHGVATPVNAALCRVAQRMLAEGMAPGTFPEAELAAMVEP